jgi:bifunctional non-homologous end joining protein LigD
MNISLFFCEGKSDKVYHLQLDKVSSGYVVNFQYGRRGSSLNSGTKTNVPVSQEDANKIYTKVLNEKLSKGYQECETTSPTVTPVSSVKKVATSRELPQLLNAIEDPETYITDDRFVAQEKMDGERRRVSFDLFEKSLTQYNKKGQAIPIVTDLKTALKGQFGIFDGEMVGDVFYVFDLLSANGTDVRELPYSKRVAMLNEFSFGKGIKIVKVARGTKEKRKLFEKLKKENKEGIVFKKEDAPYSVGRPSSGGDQLKFKFCKTATCRVSSLTKSKRSVGLEMIDGDSVAVGKVTIPPNKEVPTIGSYIEVKYLYAYKGGSLYQPIYLGERNDQDESDINIKQLVYKAE